MTPYGFQPPLKRPTTLSDITTAFGKWSDMFDRPNATLEVYPNGRALLSDVLPLYMGEIEEVLEHINAQIEARETLTRVKRNLGIGTARSSPSFGNDAKIEFEGVKLGAIHTFEFEIPADPEYVVNINDMNATVQVFVPHSVTSLEININDMNAEVTIIREGEDE